MRGYKRTVGAVLMAVCLVCCACGKTGPGGESFSGEDAAASGKTDADGTAGSRDDAAAGGETGSDKRTDTGRRTVLVGEKTEVPVLEFSEDISMDETYTNQMTLEEEWPAYGIGDPYIMKYNGVYYLYVSTKGQHQGIKVWSGENIYDWTYRGMVGEDQDATWIAYSPKVVYWNGTFYLYTTPHGQGLHVLTSDSPLGPFTDVTGRIHDCIDACIFIDDDGQWYLGHGCDVSGIEYHRMASPLEIEEEAYYPGTVVDGTDGNYWTETGEIFKRDGVYFMTYSGNHVANDSYRTLWASSDSVLQDYTPGERPLLTGTFGELRGTGCGLVFTGPDLVSDYVVYHNLESVSGPIRSMNIERVSYNGTEMNAFGPTAYEQVRGKMPTYSDNPENTEQFTGIVSAWDGLGTVPAGVTAQYRQEAWAEYVAEMNYNACGGEARLSFSDGKGVLTAEPDGGLRLALDGKEYTASYDGYRADALHTVTVDYREGRLQVFVDGMRKFNLEAAAAGGKLSYTFEKEGRVGYTAITEMDSHDAVAAGFRPYAGKFFARDYAGEYSAAGLETTDGPGRGTALRLQEGDYARYRVNAGENTLFHVSVTYRARESGTLAAVDGEGKVQGAFCFDSTEGEYVEAAITGVSLGAWYDMLTLTALEGAVDLYAFRLYPAEAAGEHRVTDIGGEEGFTMMDGVWAALNGKIMAYFDMVKDQGNLVYGNENWGDYEVETGLELDPETDGKAGVLLRVANIAEITRSKHAIYAFNDQSYYVYVTQDGTVGIDKHNYNCVNVAEAEDYLEDPFAKHTLTVRASGNVLTVYLDGEEVLSYTDKKAPYLTGRAGLHCESATATFTDFTVREIQQPKGARSSW